MIARAFPAAEVASTYDLARNVLSFGTDRFWKVAALRDAGAHTVRRQLDLGTGSGAMLSREPRVCAVGTDVAWQMLHRARVAVPSAKMVAADAHLTPFRSRTFDLVTASYLMRYASDARQIIRDARAVLRPGGVLLVLDLREPVSRWRRALFRTYLVVGTTLVGLILTGRARSFWHVWETLSNFDPHHLADLMTHEGFETVRVSGTGAGTMAWVTGRVPAVESPTG